MAASAPKLPFLLVAALAAPCIIGIVLSLVHPTEDLLTATREQLAQAAITGRQSGDQNAYTYAFDLDGKPYQGSDSSTQWHTPGDKVAVYFDPQNPEKNALKDFFDQAAKDVQPIPLFLSVGYGLVVFMSMRASRKRQPSRTI